MAAGAAVVAVLRGGGGLRALAVLGCAGAGFGTLLPFATLPEERFHLVEYGVLAVLVDTALRVRAAAEPAGLPAENGGAPPRPFALRRPATTAALVTAYAGWVDEAIQDLVPGRYYDFRDVLLNSAAAVLAAGAAAALDRLQREPRERAEPGPQEDSSG